MRLRGWYFPGATSAGCARKTQAVFRRRFHHPRRPPLAKSRPGSPAPTLKLALTASGPRPLANRIHAIANFFLNLQIGNKSPRALLLLLPLDPVIDPPTCCRACRIPRPTEPDDGGVVITVVVNEQDPFIPAQACANDVLNAFVVHGPYLTTVKGEPRS